MPGQIDTERRANGAGAGVASGRALGLGEGQAPAGDLAGAVVEPVAGGQLLLPRVLDARKLYVELTNRCNLRCQHCIRNSWTEERTLAPGAPGGGRDVAAGGAPRREGDMPLALFERLLHQVAAFPRLDTLHLCGFGEPLFHPQALRAVRLARAQRLRVEMTSNGALVGRHARAIVESGLQSLTVSVDGVRPETFGGIRRGARLSTVLENVRALAEAIRASGGSTPTLNLAFVAMRRNVAEFPELVEVGGELGIRSIFVSNLLPYSADMKDEVLYTDGAPLAELRVPRLALFDSGRPTVHLPEMRLRTTRACRFVEDGALVVGWDGEVSPCYATMHAHQLFVLGRPKEAHRLSFGNVAREELADVWRSPAYVRFRSRVRRMAYPSCGDCPIAEGCDMAESNEIDCWGNQHTCADCLWARGIVRCP